MRKTIHLQQTIALALALLLLMPAVTAAQSTPIASPEDVAQVAVWERLEGVQQAVVRTWGDVPESTPEPGEVPVLRFVTGLVAQFESEEQAAAAVEPIRDWMVASLQVNLVDVEVTVEEAEVEERGDSSAAAVATGVTGDMPLTISVVLVQDGDRLLVAGGSVMDDRDLLPLLEGIVDTMLEREPGGEETRDNVGRFSGGLWDIFPEPEDSVLEDMRRQGDLPIYQGAEPPS